jgi:hypothetical protein
LDLWYLFRTGDSSEKIWNDFNKLGVKEVDAGLHILRLNCILICQESLAELIDNPIPILSIFHSLDRL